MLLRGRIVFPPGERPDQAARVVARVEEVSLADAPAATVAEQVREHVALPRGESFSLPFEIPIDPGSIDPGHRYSVRVHVDVTGTSTVTSDDFVSTAAHPLTFESGGMAVDVRRV